MQYLTKLTGFAILPTDKRVSITISVYSFFVIYYYELYKKFRFLLNGIKIYIDLYSVGSPFSSANTRSDRKPNIISNSHFFRPIQHIIFNLNIRIYIYIKVSSSDIGLCHVSGRFLFFNRCLEWNNVNEPSGVNNSVTKVNC